MKPDKFQEEVSKIMSAIPTELKGQLYDDHNYINKLELNGLALAGEAGEVADSIKKFIWYEDEEFNLEFIDTLGKELGHVLFHVAETANVMGLSLEQIMEDMIESGRARNGMPSMK